MVLSACSEAPLSPYVGQRILAANWTLSVQSALTLRCGGRAKTCSPTVLLRSSFESFRSGNNMA